MNLLTMFSRAAKSLNLSPAERAALKLVENAFIAAAVALLPAASQVLSSQSVNWQNALHLFGVLAVPAVASALVKYFKAQGDPAIADAVAAVASDPSLSKGDLADFGKDLLQQFINLVAPAGVTPPASAAPAPAPAAPVANAVTSNASVDAAAAVAASA